MIQRETVDIQFGKEDATLYFREDILTGIGAIREFIEGVHTAFPELKSWLKICLVPILLKNSMIRRQVL